MATKHTVIKGETLTRIAKKYEFSTADAIYSHPSNDAFRETHPNPDVIYPGDIINIPDKDPITFKCNTGREHKFVLATPPPDVFKMQLEGKNGLDLSQGKVQMKVAGKTIEGNITPGGVIEIEMDGAASSQGELKVFLDPKSEKPTHEFTLALGGLEPVETLGGVQARCNLLGFWCGVADGLMGRNTREGVKEFQTAHGLDVDGVPGPMTKRTLKDAFGS